MKFGSGWCANLVAIVALGGLASAAESVSPESAIRKAMHAELYGLGDRQSVLNREQAESSESPLIQSYLGRMRLAGIWFSLEEAGKATSTSETLSEYRSLRENTRDDFPGNVTLAQWCQTKGLSVQEKAHWLRALDFEPDNREIRQRLGHGWTGSQWLTREETEQRRELLREQAEANERWWPVVVSIRERLMGSSAHHRREATKELAEITDPLAIPTLEAALAPSGDGNTLLLLETLAAMNDPRASEALSRQAVMANSPVVREQAAKLLGKRDPHSYVPQLLAAMKGPVQSRVSLSIEPDGRLLYRHEFAREGQETNEVVVQDVRITRIARNGGNAQKTLRTALAQSQQEAFRREWLARMQRLSDEQLNQRITQALALATGEQKGVEPQAWWQWWNEQNEAYNEGSKPSSVSYQGNNVALEDEVRLLTYASDGSETIPQSTPRFTPRVECFVAGTGVWTAQGEANIEKIRVGDLVLSQNMESGELEYMPVVRTTQRAATKLVRITIGNDTFDCTGGHLFWVLEQGWIKARDLKPGMVIHCADRIATVTANEAGLSSPTYNLVVEGNHNYFVGTTRCLTHDNTPRRPTKLLAPGVEAEE